MENKKSLLRIIGETIGYTPVAYLTYSGINALISQDSFIHTLKNPKTAVVVAGVSTGYLLYQVAKELVKKD